MHIFATRVKQCNDCRWDLVVKSVHILEGVMYVGTYCEGCHNDYESAFRCSAGARVLYTDSRLPDLPQVPETAVDRSDHS